MPRYRFSWSNVDPGLRRALCGSAEVGAAATETQLRSQFGARPKEAFVSACWPVLREQWLASDGVARARVVDALRASGLGDRSNTGDSLDEQLTYLRSCRNHHTLRQVVLAAFIEMGERVPQTKPDHGDAGWHAFSDALRQVLPKLLDDGVLILSVRGTGAAEDGADLGASYFVQFAGQGGQLLRAEAVSNTFLAAEERLSPEAQRQLVQLGWQPPTHVPGAEHTDPTGSPNYYREFEQPVHFDDVAQMAVATLEQVFGAPDPTYIEHSAFGDGGPLDLIDLEVDRKEPPTNTSPVDPERLLPKPANGDELAEQVALAVSAVIDGDQIVYDSDGDIPIRFGTAQVYVRAVKDQPVVEVFSILLRNVRQTPVLMEAVNDLNRQFPYTTAVCHEDVLLLRRSVPGSPFVASHLLEAIAIVGHLSDEIDEPLQAKLGGVTAHGPAVETTETEAASGPVPGYL